MTTPLAAAIDALSDPQVTLSAALRRLLVVSRRIGADDLTKLIRAELEGYDEATPLPPARQPHGLHVTVRFDGPMGSQEHVHVFAHELPADLAAAVEDVRLVSPVAELEALAFNDGDEDPRLGLSHMWIEVYRQYVAQNKVPSISMFVANKAFIRMPRTHMRGVLDRLRTSALDLALDLEGADADAGSPSGPTVASAPKLASVVTNYINVQAAEHATVTVGDHTNVAAGAGATAVQLQAGDVSGLLTAAGNLLGPDGVQALRDALDRDGDRPGEETRSFLDRVKSGTYVLAGGVATNGAYEGLVNLLQQVFPGF
ncbi:hypothetical protein [Aeromicrobium chenweiae]|uniref:AbiTii domain-containing protein n=1 Tax=Aeromicrobium chenweiae TaxID=2079793 RepID=UPI00109282EE|nr:hypothetical protein [Aeromicrobium chenweiae]TGN31678.1 hypothetical protein E4L97_11890 [Aeromicrobium chenweiae]